MPHNFPADGILWRRWVKADVEEIQRRGQPVLMFVAERNPLFHALPFLNAVFNAMPRSDTLRALLHVSCVPLFIESGERPCELTAFGAGERYHVAILSPLFDPLMTFDPVSGDPDRVVGDIAAALERIVAARRAQDLGGAP
ncbi:MAG: hypothetical protein ACREFC_01420 [Stellaceae bacterium]